MDKKKYVCQSCGFISFKWLGKCPECLSWESFREEVVQKKEKKKEYNNKALKLRDLELEEKKRVLLSFQGLNRVLGGGIVPGSLILIGGEPGVGKSTLMLQMAEEISKERKVLYVSGEESIEQIILRAKRLGIKSEKNFILCTQDLENAIEEIENLNPEVVIVDSIQTLYLSSIPSIPGTITQIREVGNLLMEIAKKKNIAFFITGQVTKEGTFAGPKALEHLVDVVIYFEGEGKLQHKMIRCYKNRFGPSSEVAFFEMKENGLEEVLSPSFLFMTQKEPLPGTSFAGLYEGSTPLIAEIQALVVPTPFVSPRRTSVGFDLQRLHLIIAVLQRHCNVDLSHFDVYLSVAGGFPLKESGADLSAAVSLVSSFKNIKIPKECFFIGEISLTGVLRQVPQIKKRIEEGKKLGFKKVFCPEIKEKNIDDIEMVFVEKVEDVLKKLNILK